MSTCLHGSACTWIPDIPNYQPWSWLIMIVKCLSTADKTSHYNEKCKVSKEEMEVFIDWGEWAPFLTFSMFKGFLRVICQPKCWKHLSVIYLITVWQVFAMCRHCGGTRFLWEQHLHPWLVHCLPSLWRTPAARCNIPSLKTFSIHHTTHLSKSLFTPIIIRSVVCKTWQQGWGL